MFKVKEHERVLTAWAEYAAGPGWANQVIWVLVEDPRTGDVRRECIQPYEQNEALSNLFPISAAVQAGMMSAITRLLNPNLEKK